MSTTAPEDSADSKPLLSRSSILILSGYLAGIGASQLGRPDANGMILLSGVCGLVAYLGLRHLAERRRRQAARAALAQATSQLEVRVDRHMSCQPANRGHRTAHRDADLEQQYLTVASSSQIVDA